MSADKHSGVARRKFAAANLGAAWSKGGKYRVRVPGLGLTADQVLKIKPSLDRIYRGDKPVDITDDIKALVKRGEAKQRRHRPGMAWEPTTPAKAVRKLSKVRCYSTKVQAYTP